MLMFLYFYLLEQGFFQSMARALARSFRERSFAGCHDLCGLLLAKNPAAPADSLVRTLPLGLLFDRLFWQGLIGECLVHGAAEIPRLETAPHTLCSLLAPQRPALADVPRVQFTPIEQVHFGSRDLRFGGGYYRPDNAGLNDREDVRRLAGYLEGIDSRLWSLDQIVNVPAEERAEELAYVRDWWPALVEMYQRARANDWVIVCEKG